MYFLIPGTIFEVDFAKIKYNLCLFAVSNLKIKLKTRHCQKENSAIFIHKMYKEKIVKKKIVNLQMRTESTE